MDIERKATQVLTVELAGLDADQHMIDAQKLGQSLLGLGKLYKSVYHFYFTGVIPIKLRSADVQILAGPPEVGSLSYALWVLFEHGRMAMYPELLCEAVDSFAPELVKAIVAKRAGQSRVAELAIEKLAGIAEENLEINKRILDYANHVETGHQSINKALVKTIDKLSQSNASAMVNMVAPIGQSARQLTHAKGASGEYVIDEPIADAIRSKGELEIEEITLRKVRVRAVDKLSRSCKVLDERSSVPLKGRITDPQLGLTEDIYTRALHTDTELLVSSKLAIKDGEPNMLYISDAKAVQDN